MNAHELIGAGRLDAALLALQDQVRKEPARAEFRTFLFQLLAVLGQWQRALTQLNVAAELDAATLPMAQTYRAAIQCEALRAEIFAGRRAPLIFGQPEPWLALLLEALKLDGSDAAAAAAARSQALELAPPSAGSINGERFDWLADADQRLGPVFEAIVDGRYFWIPMARVARLECEAPVDLRDLVWTPASFTWTNGGSAVGLIPTRYNDSVASGDAALLLGRRTEWRASHGLGQRMLASDAADYPLMEVRSIIFDAVAGVVEPSEPAGAEAAHG